MEFGVEKWTMKIGKSQIIVGTELPNQESFRTLGGKENYMYLEILEADTIKQAEMKEKNQNKKIQN